MAKIIDPKAFEDIKVPTDSFTKCGEIIVS
jgi:hypothetical protein